jgi:hypothetical protein
MGAFMVWSVALASNFPTNMVSMHATLAWLDVCSARTNIVLHTDWLIVALSILNGAAIRNLNFAFSSSAFRI